MSVAAAPVAWSRLALLAPVAALCALGIAFAVAAGRGAADLIGAGAVLAVPVVLAWVAIGAVAHVRRVVLSLLGGLVGFGFAYVSVRVIFPSLDTGQGIPQSSLQAFVLVPSAVLLVGGLLAAWVSAPPLRVMAQRGALHLRRAYPHHVALLVLWVTAALLGWLAEPIALGITQLSSNDAIAAIVVFAAPSVALGMWLGALVASVAYAGLSRFGRAGVAL